MFVVVLTYVKPIEAVDALLEAHVAWLKEHFAEGVFLLAGRRVPRSGGLILAHGIAKAELEARLALDPFATGGVAEYQVIEVETTMTEARLDFLKG